MEKESWNFFEKAALWDGYLEYGFHLWDQLNFLAIKFRNNCEMRFQQNARMATNVKNEEN